MALGAKISLIIFLCISRALAWGEHGHRTVGYLAQLYFTTDAENLVDELIKPTETFDISDGAVWPDSFNVQSKYPWSKPLHYIDAKDDPPKTCKVNFNADCDPDERCIVAAITNFVCVHLVPPGICSTTNNSSISIDRPSQQSGSRSKVPRRSSEVLASFLGRHHPAAAYGTKVPWGDQTNGSMGQAHIEERGSSRSVGQIHHPKAARVQKTKR